MSVEQEVQIDHDQLDNDVVQEEVVQSRAKSRSLDSSHEKTSHGDIHFPNLQ